MIATEKPFSRPETQRRFPFLLALLCVLMAPLGYVLSLTGLESYLQQKQQQTIRELLIQNQQALLEGRWTVRDEVERNLARYFSEHFLYKVGVRTRVIVKTRDQQVLFPVRFEGDMPGGMAYTEPFFRPDEDLNYMETAAENFRILQEGVDLLVDLDVVHSSLLANGVLGLWLLLSAGALYAGAKKTAGASAREEAEQEKRLLDLAAQLDHARSMIEEAREKEARYQARINALSSERDGLSRDVEGLLEEMEGLESGVKNQQSLREETELQVLELQEEMDRLKSRIQRPKKSEKEIDRVRKRFRALYKNLTFTDRSLEGLNDMTLDFQIKAEEILKTLNDDPESVAIKRKVFGKGGKWNILEAVFSYSGRLYFMRDEDGVSVLAIGNKNTQAKDLAYLESHRNS